MAARWLWPAPLEGGARMLALVALAQFVERLHRETGRWAWEIIFQVAHYNLMAGHIGYDKTLESIMSV